MIRAYGALHRNPALAAWCLVHAGKAAAFEANGAAYRREYLAKLAALQQLVLASGSV